MSGSRAGGLKARDKNLAADKDFYKKIGHRGGLARVSKGFGANPELARVAGRIGGAKSRRGKTVSEPEAEIHHPWKKTLWSALRGHR